MKITSGIAALAAILALFCLVVAWEWYMHFGGGGSVAQPVQQIAAATPLATPTSSPTPASVTYVPREVAKATAAPSVRPQATGWPAPAPTPSSNPASTPSVELTPYTTRGNPVISDEPMVAATLSPSAVSAKPVAEAPNAPPRIIAMSLSTPVAHGGETVSGTVQTSSNVARVDAKIAGYSTSMQKVGVGRFRLSYRVPYLPFFLHRTYTIEVIARNTRGDEVHSSVPITIR